MNKGQMPSKFILYVIIVIFAGFLLFFSYNIIKNMTESSKSNELIAFKVELQNQLKSNVATTLHPYGSVSEESFSLPPDVMSVCFFDDTKQVNLEVDPELNTFILENQGYNLFIKPIGMFKPEKLSYLELDTETNPFCIASRNNKLALKLTSRKGKTAISAVSIEDVEASCTLVKGATDTENKIDIVYLGYGYDDREDFAEDVNKYIESFAKFKPFGSNLDKFAFYRIDSFRDFDCKVGSWVTCNNFKIKRLASNCPHDFIVLLVQRNKAIDFFKPVRSSAIQNIAKINIAQNPTVFMHEFGHLFGGLADEYEDDSYYTSVDLNPADYPNCDSNSSCPAKWEHLTGTSCYRECSLSNYYRGTPNSLMRNLEADYYGVVNEDVLSKKLAVYGE